MNKKKLYINTEQFERTCIYAFDLTGVDLSQIDDAKKEIDFFIIESPIAN